MDSPTTAWDDLRPGEDREVEQLVREMLIGQVVVTDNPIYRPPSNETYCAACDHGKSHHGHYDGKRGEWVDDGKCFVWVDAPRTATGRKRGPSGCRCKGWEEQ